MQPDYCCSVKRRFTYNFLRLLVKDAQFTVSQMHFSEPLNLAEQTNPSPHSKFPCMAASIQIESEREFSKISLEIMIKDVLNVRQLHAKHSIGFRKGIPPPPLWKHKDQLNKLCKCVPIPFSIQQLVFAVLFASGLHLGLARKKPHCCH